MCVLSLTLGCAGIRLCVGWDCSHAWDGWNEQARKRQLIEQRLQDKLRKETDSVRRAEESKKDKTTANRKEEELQLKDSIECLSLSPFSALSLVAAYGVLCSSRMNGSSYVCRI